MYYEILMGGDNYKKLFSFSLSNTKRSWMYLKLEKVQEIRNGEYSSRTSEDEHAQGSYFFNLWLARRSQQGYTYLNKPFGGSNLVLDETDEITDLRSS
jgi:hypothetical protein